MRELRARMREFRARMQELRVSVQKLRIGMQKPRIGMQKPRADMQKLRVERYKEDLASVIDSLENKSLPTSSTEIPFFQTFGSVQATPSSCPKCSLDVSHHPVGQHGTSKTFLALPDMLPHRDIGEVYRAMRVLYETIQQRHFIVGASYPEKKFLLDLTH
jgi:hypothetical protein